MNFALFLAIEEQQLVCFTGKVNLLKKFSNESIGSLYLIDGKIVNGKCKDLSPLKAVFKLVSDYEKNGDNQQIVIEPELLSFSDKKLDYPHQVLVKKLHEFSKQMKEADKNRPPDNLKLLINQEFISDGGEVSPIEYDLLCTISDYNLVKDIYQNSKMFDHEITEVLVNLRKKNALRVIEIK